MIHQASVFNELIHTALVKADMHQRDYSFLDDLKQYAEECLDTAETENPTPADILQENIRNAILQFVKQAVERDSLMKITRQRMEAMMQGKCPNRKSGQHNWRNVFGQDTQVCDCGAWK